MGETDFYTAEIGTPQRFFLRWMLVAPEVEEKEWPKKGK
jgi:hypothetical protein